MTVKVKEITCVFLVNVASQEVILAGQEVAH